MSLFLENLHDVLCKEVYIDNPWEQFAKAGLLITVHSKALRQIVCMLPNIVQEGPAIQSDFRDSEIKEFGIYHINKLADTIKDWAKKIRFAPLILPKHSLAAQHHRFKNIYGRYIEDYIPMSDIIAKRWDFLIEKLD